MLPVLDSGQNFEAESHVAPVATATRRIPPPPSRKYTDGSQDYSGHRMLLQQKSLGNHPQLNHLIHTILTHGPLDIDLASTLYLVLYSVKEAAFSRACFPQKADPDSIVLASAPTRFLSPALRLSHPNQQSKINGNDHLMASTTLYLYIDIDPLPILL